MVTGTNFDPLRLAIAEAVLQIERSLCLSTEIARVQDSDIRAAFQSGLDWMERFVMKPHRHLGRKGAVCPFVHPAHEGKRLYFGAIDCREMSFELFLEVMMEVPALFGRIAEQLTARRDLLSLCIFPINLPVEDYYKFIDCAHSILKPIYMVTGLMLGEFHPMSVATGAHSETIRPLRADVPFFAARAMAVHDKLFIDRASGSAGQRIHELESYLRWTRGSLSLEDIARCTARIDELKRQLVGDEDHVDAPV
jgi:hypothetical protein